MSEQKDHLDVFIDEALKSYGAAPEDERLARRIMIHVAERQRVRYSKEAWILAASLALIAGTVYMSWSVTSRAKMIPAATAIVIEKQIQMPASPVVPAPVRHVAVRRTVNQRTARQTREPKLARFPTPSPITSEERALVYLATAKAQNSTTELTTLGGPVTPIQITAIEIKPLHLEMEHEGATCCER